MSIMVVHAVMYVLVLDRVVAESCFFTCRQFIEYGQSCRCRHGTGISYANEVTASQSQAVKEHIYKLDDTTGQANNTTGYNEKRGVTGRWDFA